MHYLKNIFIAILLMATGATLTLFLPKEHQKDSPEKTKNKPTRKEPVPVKVVQAELKDAQAFNEFPGTVQSHLSVAVMSQITGRILLLNASSGQSVKKGELLVQLDAEEIRTRIRQTESSFAAAQSTLTSAKLDWLALSAKIDAAKASLTEAQQDYERFQQLVKQNVEPRRRLEEAESRWKNAKSALESIEATVKAGESAIKTQEAIVSRSQAQIDEAKAQLDYTEIRSPIAGVVLDKYAEVGDLATPGRQLLILQDATQLRMEASVSESCARRIRIGNPVYIQLDALQENLEMTVTEIVPAIDPASRSFLVRTDLPIREELKPGMFGRLQFPCGIEKLLSLAPETILERGQLNIIFVVQENKAHLRLVRTGRKQLEHIEILSGVNQGELVILHPPTSLQEGDLVQILSSTTESK